MNQTKKGKGDEDSFLFRVEILVGGPTNRAALEHLLRVLNDGGFTDYRIGSGINRGRSIEEAAERERKKRAPSADVPGSNAKQSPAKAAPEAAVPSELEQRIRRYIETNKLVRLNVNKGLGVRLNMPCRILNFDAGKQLLTVYHDDEKQVHTLKLFEIDDFCE